METRNHMTTDDMPLLSLPVVRENALLLFDVDITIIIDTNKASIIRVLKMQCVEHWQIDILKSY